MTEKQIFRVVNGTGDGAAEYTEAELCGWIQEQLTGDNNDRGVVYRTGTNVRFEATATPGDPGTNDITIQPGRAIVLGRPYTSTGIEIFNVDDPRFGTTGHRIVLRMNRNSGTNTARLTRLSSSDGTATFPSITQDATTWDIKLWGFTITTGGTVTFTDEREWVNAVEKTVQIPAYIGLNVDANTLLLPGVVGAYGWGTHATQESNVHGNWIVPKDVIEVTSIEVIIRFEDTEPSTARIDNYAYHGDFGAADTGSFSNTASTISANSTNMRVELPMTSGVDAIAPGEYMNFLAKRNDGVVDGYTGEVGIFGWRVTYLGWVAPNGWTA